ncbi:MAG: rhomboid family intramembrane serine protease, partial [Planctomycetia bacterium]|nr:rhomboid family intramembrane serine protease [Planctomycetia bacterium]
MGIYDRDYYREDYKPSRRNRRNGGIFGFFNLWSAMAILILVNVVLFFANGLFTPNDNSITAYTAMFGTVLSHPFEWYRLVTYGFAHDPSNFKHILFNMITLFFFAPPVEQRYGKKEFFLIYFVSIISCGLVWGFMHWGSENSMLGASGAISTIVILFALNYPHAQVLLFGIIPMPAWLLGVLYIVLDTMGTFNSGSNIAHDVHLTGAALALIYFFGRWRFSNLFRWPSLFNKKSNLRVWKDSPSSKAEDTRANDKLEQEVDRLLRKISATGEESLTESERQTLREA